MCVYCVLCYLCILVLDMSKSYDLFSMYYFFFFKQKTAYEMRISDWSSDVCSSDLSTHLINQALITVFHRFIIKVKLQLRAQAIKAVIQHIGGMEFRSELNLDQLRCAFSHHLNLFALLVDRKSTRLNSSH